MQPVTLHHRLKACGIDKPDISGWKYWRKRHELDPAHAGYFARLGFLLYWPIFGLSLLWLFNLVVGLDLPIDKRAVSATIYVVFSVASGAALGLGFGVGFGVAYGVSFGVAFGVAIGAFGLTFDLIPNVRDAVVAGVAVGMALSAADCIARGVANRVLFEVSSTLGLGIASSVMGGLTFGVVFSVAAILVHLRIPIYPIEALIQWILFLARRKACSLRYSPLLFHDLSYLPHPFLARHIVESADADPDLAARVLEACRIAPGQRQVGARALAELQARELATLARRRGFLASVELQGRWLPGKDTDNALLSAQAETARLFAAAQGSTSPYLARQHLDSAERQLTGIDNLLLVSKEPLARFLPDTLAAWHTVLAEMRAENRLAAADQIPNPFIAGNPLSGEQPAGKAIFRGRETTIRQVETLLGNDQASLALIGPRRCGKSSLINMFRVLLPDTQVVLFDLQDNPASTPEAFYRSLAEQARKQAFLDRRLSLPAFPEGPPIEALRAWLDALEQFPGVSRFLICIDEFERLPSLFPGQGRELLQFMGLMRATIQHRRRVRLLVAGAAPFDELDSLWSDHFINLREIRIGYLDEATCVGLLTRPIPEFPPEAIPAEIARAVVARTGGQPFLVQLFGSLFVDELNEVKRKSATLNDMEPVEVQVLEQANYYFRNVWNDLPAAAQDVVRALAVGVHQVPDAVSLRLLRRRLILAEDTSLLTPVFGRWVRENVIEPKNRSYPKT